MLEHPLTFLHGTTNLPAAMLTLHKQLINGKIGSVALKDCDLRKTPPKA